MSAQVIASRAFMRFAPCAAIAAAMWVAFIAAAVLQPHLQSINSVPSLEAAVPEQFGDWTVVPSPHVQVDPSVTRQGEQRTEQPYDEVVMRTYRHTNGELVMLALAYGRNQRQELKIHRPELCYAAQGFDVLDLRSTTLSDIGGTSSPVTGKRMLARSASTVEAVSYWIRIGAVYSESAVATRAHIFLEGLEGRVPDGILVRASRTIREPEQAAQTYPALESFLVQLVAAVDPAARPLLSR